MIGIVSGFLVATQAIAGLLFLRFWKRSGETLFIWFAVAFWVLALQRLGIALTTEETEATLFYVVRLLAFLLILAAIGSKNRPK